MSWVRNDVNPFSLTQLEMREIRVFNLVRTLATHEQLAIQLILVHLAHQFSLMGHSPELLTFPSGELCV